MSLLTQKEKIKQEIDLIEDKVLLSAISELIHERKPSQKTKVKIKKYKSIDPKLSVVNEPPLTDEEIAIPGGRTPTRAQIEEWLDRPESGETMSIEEAFAQIKKNLKEHRSKGNSK